MEANITRILWIVIVLAAVSLAVWFAWSIYGGTMRGTADFQAYSFELFYDGSTKKAWGYFKLKNVGSVDITSLKVNIADSDVKSVTNAPSTADPLTPGEEVQVQLGDLGGASGVGKVTIKITATTADGRTVTHTYTAYVRSP